jgi:hypothetical protein
MGSSFTNLRVLVGTFALALTAVGACTQVQVEDTRVSFLNTTCQADRNSGGQAQGSAGPSQTQASDAIMDTYIVQIFELNDPSSPSPGDCDTCVASRSNCFLEKESCVCGGPIAVSPAGMEEMLKGLRVGLPANYGSVYCTRVMAVQRFSEPEQCACDPNWETPDKVRLCSVSAPYAASSLPVGLQVQCTNNHDFSTCLGQAAN